MQPLPPMFDIEGSQSMPRHYHAKPLTVMFCCLIAALLHHSSYEVHGDPQKTESHEKRDVVSRDEVLEIAGRYADHRWQASANNVFHGRDQSGIYVDTPDSSFHKDGFVIGSSNVGIPYKWGGFSSLADFDRGLLNGKFAGHLRKGRSPGSAQAVGVDCSGLVSRCWDLPRKHSTRSLGNFCYRLKSYDDLLPGDILNRFDKHVMIFESFVDPTRNRIAVYEAVYPRVKRNIHSVADLKAQDYVPLRYMPLDERWSSNKLEPVGFQRSTNDKIRFVVSSGRVHLQNLENPVAQARPGEWAKYRFLDGETTYSITRRDENRVVVREQFSRRGKSQFRERCFDQNLFSASSLIASGGFDQDFGEIQVVQSEVIQGECSIGERAFDSVRIRLQLKTSLLTRGIINPVEIDIDCVLSEQVPVNGVIRCRFEVETGRGKTLKTTVRNLELLECSAIASRES